MVWYSHLFKNFPQFVVIHTVKGFSRVNEAEVDVFLELLCFLHDPNIFLFMSLLYCFEYCTFIVQSEVKEPDSFLQLHFLFENCFGYFGSFIFPYFQSKFKIFCSRSTKTAIDNLIGTTLNLKTSLGSIVILTVFFQSKTMVYFSICVIFHLFH